MYSIRQTFELLIDGEIPLPEATQWNRLNRDLQKYIFNMLPYYDLCRYQNVCKRWKKDITDVLDTYHSSRIYYGLIEIKYDLPDYNFRFCHDWYYSIHGTPKVENIIKELFPEGNDNHTMCKEWFANEMIKLFTNKFILERIRTFNILFDHKFDLDAPIFSEHVLSTLVVMDNSDEFFVKINCKKPNINSLTYGFGCLPISKINVDNEDYSISFQKDLVWLGIERGFNIKNFQRCLSCGLMESYICLHKSQWPEYGGNGCECIYDCICAKWCQCSKCTCKELDFDKDPDQWQYWSEHMGFKYGQHIIELIIYKTQRVFNALGINWRKFSFLRTDISKLKNAYETYCQNNPLEISEQMQ